MKKSRILAGAILAGGLWTGSAFGQAPAAPAAGAAADPAAAAAAKPGICEKIEKGIDRKRRKLCQTPIGQMLNSITKPLTAATGGIIPGFCPAKPSAEDLKKPGAEGAAAQAMKDAVEAAARRKAVRLLGTFDCHWHPEAELGLAAALRTDRAECVRLEAAIALNRGCCCTRLIVEALEETVGGTDKLGPSENSPRVQAVAAMALERCLQCPEATMIDELPPVDDKKEEKKEEKGEAAGTPRTANAPGSAKPLNPPPSATPAGPTLGPATKGSGKPSRELIEKARRTLAAAEVRLQRGDFASDEPIPAGQRSLLGLAQYAVHGGSSPATQTPTPTTALAVRTPAPAVKNSAMVAETKPPVVAPRPLKPATPPAPLPATVPTSTPVTPFQPPAANTAPAATSPVRTVTNREQPTNVRTIDPNVLRCLETLRDAENPDVRHGAVRTLVTYNWREHPEAVAGLLHAARYDKHAGMRVACIRSLAAIKAATPEVMTSLKTITSDPDEWIRQETIQALTYLQAVLPPQSASLQTSRPALK